MTETLHGTTTTTVYSTGHSTIMKSLGKIYFDWAKNKFDKRTFAQYAVDNDVLADKFKDAPTPGALFDLVEMDILAEAL
jgi:hypothetical protein